VVEMEAMGGVKSRNAREEERRRWRVWFLKEISALKVVRKILCGPRLR